MGRLFGTDGIRGKANRYPMDGLTAFSIGQAVASLLKEKTAKPRIVIGRDTRISGSMLEHALAAGIASMGAHADLAGVLPTPGVAFLCRSMGAGAGMVISASHNPYEDNGIKIFSGTGFKLPDEEEASIEALVLEGRLMEMTPSPEKLGRVETLEDAVGAYIDFLKGCFPEELSMKGLKLALDTANGAAYQAAPALFTSLGADVDVLHNQPDGTNINRNCGSQFTQDLRQHVIRSGAVVGLAFDGDGDRLVAVDETGRELTGDRILLTCALALKAQGRLKDNRVVSTVMSNLGLISACRKYGITHHAAKVGDRYVMEDMKRLGAVLGGEDSGHLIFLEHHTTGDGIVAALQLIAAMLRQDRPLSELADRMSLYPQVLINVHVARKPVLSSLPGIVDAISEAERELGDEGRVLVRYSGTQDMCRVMVEGPTREIAETNSARIAEAVKRAVS